MWMKVASEHDASAESAFAAMPPLPPRQELVRVAGARLGSGYSPIHRKLTDRSRGL
jgi:hypothetical protein